MLFHINNKTKNNNSQRLSSSHNMYYNLILCWNVFDVFYISWKYEIMQRRETYGRLHMEKTSSARKYKDMS